MNTNERLKDMLGTSRSKGYYFIRIPSGERLGDHGWETNFIWKPAFYNPDGYSTPKWFPVDGPVTPIDPSLIVEVNEQELASAVGLAIH